MRGIISKNSLRVDPDGDVFEDGDVDSTVELSDYDEDPYKDVRVEGKRAFYGNTAYTDQPRTPHASHIRGCPQRSSYYVNTLYL